MQRVLSSTRRIIVPSNPRYPSLGCYYSSSPRRRSQLSEEDKVFEEHVKQTEEWFASPRFAQIKRPYTAAQVVDKRGTLPVVYPCEHQARKLWNLLKSYAAAKKPLQTMGAIDPIQMTQMAPHQEVLYVSGWASSSVLASGMSFFKSR
jgi:isocitrate lyase